MDELIQRWEALRESLTATLIDIGAYLPVLVAAAVVMLVGWLVAYLLRGGFLKLEAAIHRLLSRFSRTARPTTRQITRRIVALLANFIFWIIILLFAALAARVAGLEAFSLWLDRVVAYIPTLLAGLLITLAGYLLSTLVRDIVSTALVSAGARANEIASFTAQGAVFVTALVIGLDQIGIDVTFLIILVAVLVGGALLSIAIAFGFGAREFISNLIAANRVQSMLSPGDFASVGNVEGRVAEITATSVVLINENGRIVIPASLFQREVSTVRHGDSDE